MHFTVKYQYILNTLKLLIYLKYDVTPFPYQLIHVFCQTVTSIQDVQNQNDKMSAHFFFQDIIDYVKCSSDKLPYPIISDKSRDLAVKLGMVDPAEKDNAGLPLTCRAVSIYVVLQAHLSHAISNVV